MSLARKSTATVEQYKSNEISTVSQGKLIVMLYDGAIRFLNIALENNTPRKYDVVNNHILKAGEIVTELMLALNLEQGGEVANNLLGIYVYIKKRLLEANMKKDSEIIQEIIKYMEDLKSAWEEIEKKREIQCCFGTFPKFQSWKWFVHSGVNFLSDLNSIHPDQSLIVLYGDKILLLDQLISNQKRQIEVFGFGDGEGAAKIEDSNLKIIHQLCSLDRLIEKTEEAVPQTSQLIELTEILFQKMEESRLLHSQTEKKMKEILKEYQKELNQVQVQIQLKRHLRQDYWKTGTC